MTQNAINNSASSMDIDNINIDANTISSTDTNGNIILAPDGSGEISVTAAPIVPSADRADSLGSNTNSWDNVFCDGVTFDDGTNVLGNYVVMTAWTPTLEFGGATTGITYTSRTGTYTRIGELAWMAININLSSKGTDTGACTIEGLPFTTTSAFMVPFRWSLLTLLANQTSFLAVAPTAVTFINIQEAGDNTAFANVLDTAVSNTSQFFVSGFFRL